MAVLRVFSNCWKKQRMQQLHDLQLTDFVSAEDAIGDLAIGDRPLTNCTDSQSPQGYFEATPREQVPPIRF